MNTGKTIIKPGRWWYGLAIAIDVITFIACLMVFIHLVEYGCSQVSVPGIYKMKFSSGTYTVFFESLIEGKNDLSPQDLINNLKCVVRSVYNTEEISVSKTSYSPEHYEVGGYESDGYRGTPICKFKIIKPGIYFLSFDYSAPEVHGINLMIEKTSPGHSISSYDFTAFSIGSVFMVLLSVVIILATFLKRRKAKKRMAILGN